MTAVQGQERLRSVLRVAIAVSALLIYFGDASEHPARRPLAQAVLFVFLGYAVLMYLVAVRRERYVSAAVAPWIDLTWVTLLIGVSEGTSSIFYPLYLFPILYASFGGGFRRGMVVVLAAVASFAVVGATTAPRGPAFELNAFVTRPLYLLLLGYMTAAWGAHEVRSRARLALLRDVTSLSNPRFGIERTVGRFLEAVRRFYDADSCLLVVAEQQPAHCWMRTATREGSDDARPVTLPPEMAKVLLPEPPDAELHILVRRRRRWFRPGPLELERFDAAGSPVPRRDPDVPALLANTLDAASLLSIPFRYHASAVGRVHIVRRSARSFDRSELDFVRHLLDQVLPVLENIRLVDRLASDAAEEERRRIARDLHDSVIQPYLGLRLGLSAAQTAITAGRVGEGSAHVARLVELADGEIQTLRRYVRGLREGESGSGGGLLDEGVRRFCSRFSEATGIRVEVASEGGPVRNDRLAAEVFQMVAEALSNVRRHTSAANAEVRIRSVEDRLHLSVTNDGAGLADPEFFPRSLGERATALGGGVHVERPADGTTVVHVEIPL
jgi:signal transduction histidine kinase